MQEKHSSTLVTGMGETLTNGAEKRNKETDLRWLKPQPRKIDGSVVVCAYTELRWDDLLAAVRSVEEQTVQPREIIVVIDHNPSLFERARQTIPGVTILENGQERGLSGARNTGIQQAAGAVLVFMDEDAVAEPDWLERLYTHYEAGDIRGSVIGVGGAIEPWWISGKPGWFPEEFNWVVGCTYRGMPETPAPVRNLIGANMSYRREVFETVGGFTVGMGRVGTLPLGCEETELCIRASQANEQARFLFEPRAVVRHRVPAARATWRYFFSRCYSEGISKAQVANLVGAQQGLSSERAYTFRTLPKGVLRGIGEALRGDWNGMGRAAAIISGLLVTSFGYAVGLIKVRISSRNRTAAPNW